MKESKGDLKSILAKLGEVKKQVTVEKPLYIIEIFSCAPDGEKGYHVSVRELPGCVSQGETIQEACTMIGDVITQVLRVKEAEGFKARPK